VAESTAVRTLQQSAPPVVMLARSEAINVTHRDVMGPRRVG
jgi:hypothetical protein